MVLAGVSIERCLIKDLYRALSTIDRARLFNSIFELLNQMVLIGGILLFRNL